MASVRDRSRRAEPRALTLVRGLIGSEKQPFFGDPAVAAAFARHGLRLEVDVAGSRQIARSDLSHYDFAFPAGAPAAVKIQHDHKVTAVYQPFHTPMAVATFKPIAELLRRAGVMRPLAGGYWRFDVTAYLELVARGARWVDLPGNTAYPARKSVLISSTDVRTSNSGAMYLSLASYVLNGDNVVSSAGQGDRLVGRVAPLFLRQGLVESSTEEPFDDYLAIGIGKTPLVMCYESQFLSHAAAHDGSITGDMVLAYPEPTVFSKHTLVPLDPAGDSVGRLPSADPELRRLEVRHGFRTADAATMQRYLAERRVPAPPTLVDPKVAEQLEATADAFAESLAALDAHSPDFAGKVGSINRMGDREMRDAASVSNRMLQRPLRAMGSGLFDAGSPVSRTLIDLRNTIQELDPAKQDLFSPRRLLGLIPMGSKLRDHFDRYQSSQVHLNAIIDSLYRGQDELRKDNASIEQEKVNLWATMGRLQQYALIAQRLDRAVEDRAAALEASDPERARLLRDDVLFYVRQKHQDLLTQLAVAVQGYLALDLVRRNNLELIKGVDRATTTTVAALRTAVMVAQALANQKLVLDQITALNTTTGTLIESTSSMLRQQTREVHDQAASATINLNQLKTAFANIFATMDAIDSYKGAALASMRSTVEALEEEVGKARGYLERAQAGPDGEIGGGGAGELALPATGRS
jgi:uncharacterized protein YaaN involved in tellurite resistance